MKKDAKLSDLIKKDDPDEQHYSKVNHKYADGDTPTTKKMVDITQKMI